ncbi:MAG: hypothetical protein ACHP7H_00740 [Hyphomicrobiales bacterium]
MPEVGPETVPVSAAGPVPPIAVEALALVRKLTAVGLDAQAFASRLMTPSIAALAKRGEDAATQQNAADTLRNRAATRPEGPERDELLLRANKFEARARVLASGEVMPRELRYPLDSLKLVAAARDAIVDAIAALDLVDTGEIEFFMRQLKAASPEDVRIGALDLQPVNPSMICRNPLGAAAELLGAYVDDEGVMSLRVAALAVTATAGGAPSPQPHEKAPAPVVAINGGSVSPKAEEAPPPATH